MAAFVWPISLEAQPFHVGEREEDVEIVVNVLPGRGGEGGDKPLKFDEEAIYREDQEVIQTILGSTGNDAVYDIAVREDGLVMLGGALGGPGTLKGARHLGVSSRGDSGAFIAVADPMLRKIENFAILDSDVAAIRELAFGKDGSLFAGGDLKDKGLVVYKFSPDLSKKLWRATADGDEMTGMALMEDESVVVSPNKHPFISRIKPDGSGLIPFGKDRKFRTDGKNPQIRDAWWYGNEYPESGVASASYHRGNAGGVGVLRDGNLVFLTTNFVKHKNGSPDFDPMLVKFTPEGEVIWATHLLQGLPALSDHKSPDIYVCPYSGDIMATMRQHGHFSTNLKSSKDAVLDPAKGWLTGNIMIGWVGRINPADGELKAGTFYFPDMRRPPEGGKLTANSLLPSKVRTDKEGNVYLIGNSAYKLDATMHAFQSEKMGSCGFISVFNPQLNRLRYANLITGRGFGHKPVAVAITETGPVVASTLEMPKVPASDTQIVTANSDKTNYGSDKLQGNNDVLISLLPSAPWLENW